MIFDRTSDDVKKAEDIYENKVKNFIELTDEDIDILERGRVTINTINRIERKQEELKDILQEMGYFANTSNRLWATDEIFYSKDLKRLVENNKMLRNAFFVFDSTPGNATDVYYYQEFNKLEKILVDIERMSEEIKKMYRICGTFNCGEEL